MSQQEALDEVKKYVHVDISMEILFFAFLYF